MNIQVLGKTELHLTRLDLDELNINPENEITRYSAVAMFVTSLARCTFAVLEHYAKRLEIPTENISSHLTWDYLDEPTRINRITMKIHWPELPEKRINSIARASHKCIISTSIKDSIKINTTVSN